MLPSFLSFQTTPHMEAGIMFLKACIILLLGYGIHSKAGLGSVHLWSEAKAKKNHLSLGVWSNLDKIRPDPMYPEKKKKKAKLGVVTHAFLIQQQGGRGRLI